MTVTPPKNNSDFHRSPPAVEGNRKRLKLNGNDEYMEAHRETARVQGIPHRAPNTGRSQRRCPQVPKTRASHPEGNGQERITGKTQGPRQNKTKRRSRRRARGLRPRSGRIDPEFMSRTQSNPRRGAPIVLHDMRPPGTGAPGRPLSPFWARALCLQNSVRVRAIGKQVAFCSNSSGLSCVLASRPNSVCIC